MKIPGWIHGIMDQTRIFFREFVIQYRVLLFFRKKYYERLRCFHKALYVSRQQIEVLTTFSEHTQTVWMCIDFIELTEKMLAIRYMWVAL